MQHIRPSKFVEDEFGLTELQKQNWHHFVEKISVKSEDKTSYFKEGTDLDNDLILDAIKNLKSCKIFYNNAYNIIGAFLNEYL